MIKFLHDEKYSLSNEYGSSTCMFSLLLWHHGPTERAAHFRSIWIAVCSYDSSLVRANEKVRPPIFSFSQGNTEIVRASALCVVTRKNHQVLYEIFSLQRRFDQSEWNESNARNNLKRSWAYNRTKHQCAKTQLMYLFNQFSWAPMRVQQNFCYCLIITNLLDNSYYRSYCKDWKQ